MSQAQISRTTQSARSYVSRGAAHVPAPANARQQHYIFVLLPKLSMLAFSAAIEPLRIANQLTGTALYTWETRSEDGAPVPCSNGVAVSSDAPLGVVPAAANVFVCSGVEPERSCSDKVASWVRESWRRGGVVGGLCTGAYTLALAGILKGHKFTLHWENEPAFRENYPHLVPLQQIYTIDRRIITCSGGGSATDLMLRLIYDDYGADLFQAVMDMCLHPFHRTETQLQKNRISPVQGVRHPRLIALMTYFKKHLTDDLDLADVAAKNAISRRQMERLFRQYTGLTPHQYLKDLRLAHARALLANTDMSVTEVAMASGFGNVTHFGRVFRVKFGVTPAQFGQSSPGQPNIVS